MELVTTKICMALDLGVHGNLFGGSMMSFLDEAAAAYACQICDSAKMVTMKIEEVVFQSPVRVGNLIKIYASVDKFGNTSVTINLEARKHNVHTGKQELVCSTKMIFVKLDEEGSKAALIYGQMNEPPGARARVALSGLTVAEYFRDVEGKDVLFFIDKIFFAFSHDCFNFCILNDSIFFNDSLTPIKSSSIVFLNIS